MEASTEEKATGIDAVVRYLQERGIGHDVVDHEQTFSAAEEASAAGVAPDHAAKTMVLRDGESYRLAVIPASERLDLRKAREALGASSHLRLASETEMGADFDAFDVGAVPPLGPMVAVPEALDRRLMTHDRILCSGGDHRHSVLLDPRDLAQATQAKVVDICEEDTPR
jgi:Ala-tRNA(Pro) deacylase